MRMTTAFILCSVTAAFALQAPLLLEAVSKDNDRVEFSWRNNSTAYEGLIIVRREEAESDFSLLDSLHTVAETYTDTTVINNKTYHYGIIAYSESEVSDTSNIISVKVEIIAFVKPGLKVYWDTTVMTLTITDSSTIEKGYRIFRCVNFGEFTKIYQDEPDDAAFIGEVTWEDSDVTVNDWYQYYIEFYTDGKTEISDTAVTYTVKWSDVFGLTKKELILDEKLDEFPAHFKSWSCLVGDSILLNETNLPESTYSILNISDENGITIDGVGRSFVAEFEEAVVMDNMLIGKNGDYIYIAELKNNEFILLDKDTVYIEEMHIKIEDIRHAFNNNSYLTVSRYFGAKGGGRFFHNLYKIIDSKIVFDTSLHFFSYSRYDLGFKGDSMYVGGIYYGFYGGIRINDFTLDTPHSRLFRNFPRPPVEIRHSRMFGNYRTNDSLILAAADIQIDSTRKIVYIFSDTLLQAWRYTIQSGTEISNRQISKRPGLPLKGNVSVTARHRWIVIDLPIDSSPYTISLFDIQGKSLKRISGFEGNRLEIDTGDIQGIIVVTVNNGERVTGNKLLKIER
jgi:hypothetical protein